MAFKLADIWGDQRVVKPRQECGLGTISQRASDFTAILESARSAIFVFDGDGIITYVNSRTMAELGTDESPVGRHIWDVFPGAEQETFANAYRKVAAQRVPMTFEAFSPARDGWYEAHFAPLGDGVYASFQNVDDRRASANRLKRSEERYRLAAKATNDLIWDWDLVTDALEWNENLAGCFGYGLDDLGSTGDWWKSKVHPNDIARVLTTVHKAFDDGGETFDGEYRFQRADGSYAVVHDRGYVVRDDEGRPIRMVGAMQDLSEARRAARTLAERERLMATVFGQAMVGILHRDLRTGELVVNERFCQIVARSPDELRDLDHDDYTHAEDIAWNRVLFTSHRFAGEPFQVQKRYLRPSGEIVWCNVHVSFVRDEEGNVASCIVVAEDITSRRVAELELVRSQALLQTVIDSVDDLIFVKDQLGTFVLTNRALDEGCGPLTNRRTQDLFDGDLATGYDEGDRRVLESGEPYVIDEMIPIKGYPRSFQTIKVPWQKDGRIAGIIGVSRDITERLATEENLRWSATHDSLTGLPNRRLLQEELTAAIAEAQRSETIVAVMQVDLDHFKYVNDSLGHDAGDALLTHVAERLRNVVRIEGIVARTGGDEFAIVLPGVESVDAARALAADVLETLRAPHVHDGHMLDCRASIGVGLYPVHGWTPEQLLKAADVALYRAKARGRGQVILFAPEMRTDIQKRSSMINAARDALTSDRVLPFYQPKIDLRSGAVAGFEALLRWHDRNGLLRTPGEIAAAFEDAHLCCDISDRMIDRVIRDMRRWTDDGIDFGHVAVNAAAADFRHGDFAERLLERLEAAGLAPKHLQLEVTETVFIGQGTEYVERALRTLSAAGVQIALDDFGTGYASLRHLREFPVDCIKLDRSFISGLDRDGGDAAIVRAMLNLGHSIGIEVVAEGIETQSQASHLLRLGCPLGQGFLFSKAVDASQVPALLTARPRWHPLTAA